MKLPEIAVSVWPPLPFALVRGGDTGIGDARRLQGLERRIELVELLEMMKAS